MKAVQIILGVQSKEELIVNAISAQPKGKLFIVLHDIVGATVTFCLDSEEERDSYLKDINKQIK